MTYGNRIQHLKYKIGQHLYTGDFYLDNPVLGRSAPLAFEHRVDGSDGGDAPERVHCS